MRNLVAGSLLGILLTLSLVAVAADAQPPSTGERGAIPFKAAEGPSGAALMGRVLAGFAVVLIVGIGAVYLLKRYAPGMYSYRTTGAERIRLVEIRRVTPRLTLFLVRVDGDELLLAQSGDQLKSLWQHPAGGDRIPESKDG